MRSRRPVQKRSKSQPDIMTWTRKFFRLVSQPQRHRQNKGPPATITVRCNTEFRLDGQQITLNEKEARRAAADSVPSASFTAM
uniref:60S ribosomal protein L44 n=1 Tax=Macrostomum lignano TaxID=282301 RepID=A0A1I8JQJ2_9PLAT